MVHHLDGMREIVLVSPALNGLDPLELRQLRQDVIQQTGLVHQAEAHGRVRGDQDLVEFFDNAFLGKDFHPVLHPTHGVQGFRDDGKRHFRRTELGGESDGPEHSEGIVAISDVRVQRGTDDAGGQVTDAAEGVDQGPEVLRLQAESHGIDREIPAFLVVFQRPVLHNRLAGIPLVRLFPGADELDLRTMVPEHGRPEIPEYGNVAVVVLRLLDMRRHGLRQGDAAPLYHDVDVIVPTAQEAVPDISSDHKGTYARLPGHFTDQGEDRMVQKTACYRRHRKTSAAEGTAADAKITKNGDLSKS